jgi:hypothetical protein
MDMRDQLGKELADISPQYGTARETYAEMSQPINAMEALQSLKLTDARGNITLAKVKNAIEGLQRQIKAPGTNAAKSITEDQLNILQNIHDDLLRQDLLGKGRSIGSNTFQNLSTDNILSTMLPGKLGNMAINKAGGAFGQVGRIAYSGPNEAIRNRLTDMLLNPEIAQAAIARTNLAKQPTNALVNSLGNSAARIVPVAPALLYGQ